MGEALGSMGGRGGDEYSSELATIVWWEEKIYVGEKMESCLFVASVVSRQG